MGVGGGMRFLTLYGTVRKREKIVFLNQNAMNPLQAELNPICPLLALLGAHHILHISRSGNYSGSGSK